VCKQESDYGNPSPDEKDTARARIARDPKQRDTILLVEDLRCSKKLAPVPDQEILALQQVATSVLATELWPDFVIGKEGTVGWIDRQVVRN
jgi:hypothetical protein